MTEGYVFFGIAGLIFFLAGVIDQSPILFILGLVFFVMAMQGKRKTEAK
jgi:hypothetical protein